MISLSPNNIPIPTMSAHPPPSSSTSSSSSSLSSLSHSLLQNRHKSILSSISTLMENNSIDIIEEMIASQNNNQLPLSLLSALSLSSSPTPSSSSSSLSLSFDHDRLTLLSSLSTSLSSLSSSFSPVSSECHSLLQNSAEMLILHQKNRENLSSHQKETEKLKETLDDLKQKIFILKTLQRNIHVDMKKENDIHSNGNPLPSVSNLCREMSEIYGYRPLLNDLNSSLSHSMEEFHSELFTEIIRIIVKIQHLQDISPSLPRKIQTFSLLNHSESQSQSSSSSSQSYLELILKEFIENRKRVIQQKFQFCLQNHQQKPSLSSPSPLPLPSPIPSSWIDQQQRLLHSLHDIFSFISEIFSFLHIDIVAEREIAECTFEGVKVRGQGMGTYENETMNDTRHVDEISLSPVPSILSGIFSFSSIGSLFESKVTEMVSHVKETHETFKIHCVVNTYKGIIQKAMGRGGEKENVLLCISNIQHSVSQRVLSLCSSHVSLLSSRLSKRFLPLSDSILSLCEFQEFNAFLSFCEQNKKVFLQFQSREMEDKMGKKSDIFLAFHSIVNNIHISMHSSLPLSDGERKDNNSLPLSLSSSLPFHILICHMNIDISLLRSLCDKKDNYPKVQNIVSLLRVSLVHWSQKAIDFVMGIWDQYVGREEREWNETFQRGKKGEIGSLSADNLKAICQKFKSFVSSQSIGNISSSSPSSSHTNPPSSSLIVSFPHLLHPQFRHICEVIVKKRILNRMKNLILWEGHRGVGGSMMMNVEEACLTLEIPLNSLMTIKRNNASSLSPSPPPSLVNNPIENEKDAETFLLNQMIEEMEQETMT